MSYTNVWSDTIPPGSTAAKLIDDFMRQVRLDIHERMNTLVGDWTADPIKLLPANGGAVTGKNIFIHHSAFQNDSSNHDWTRVDVSLSSSVIGTVKFWAPVILPIGATITGVSFNITAGGLLGSSFKLRKFVFNNTAPGPPSSPPVASDIATGVVDNAAFKDYIINFTYVVQNNDVLFLEITMNTGCVFYGAAITYNIDNVGQTL